MNTLFDNGTHKIETAGVESIAPPTTKITKLAFLNRFTDEEAIAIDLSSIGDTVQAASVRRYMSKVNAATFIDLNLPETISGVYALVPSLISESRAVEILTAPVQPSEIA